MNNKTLMYFDEEVGDFKNKELCNSIHNFIKTFYNDNMEMIAGDGFSKKIVFGKSKREELIRRYGCDESHWKTFVKSYPKIQVGENSSDITNNLLMLHYAYTKDEQYLKFLTIRLFTSKHYKAFPAYVDENKMKALINSLSNKFFIKKLGSLDKTLDKTIETFLDTYKSRFNKLDDDNLIYLINAISTRVGAVVKYIQIKYYNFTQTQYTDVEILDRDNARATTNDTLKFDSIINQTINIEASNKLDRTSFKQAGGTYEDKKVMDKIYKEHFPEMRTLVTIMVDDYLAKNPGATLEGMNRNFIQYTFTNRQDKSKLNESLDTLVSDIGIEETDKAKYKDLIKKYIAIRIYRNVLRQLI